MDLTPSRSFSSTIGNTSSSSWGAGGGASAMVTSVSSAMTVPALRASAARVVCWCLTWVTCSSAA